MTVIMARTIRWQGCFVLAVLRTLLGTMVSRMFAMALSPNPLPPANPNCVDFLTWSTPNFNPRNCYTALARFDAREVVTYRTRPFEFLAPQTPATSVFPGLSTPRKYFFGEQLLGHRIENANIQSYIAHPQKSDIQSRNMHFIDRYAQVL